MEKALAQFTLEDGTPFLVEIDNPNLSGAIESVSSIEGELVYKAKMSLDEALDRISPVASAVIYKLKQGLTTPSDEVEIAFGLKLSAEAGAILSSTVSEGNFEVKLKYRK